MADSLTFSLLVSPRDLDAFVANVSSRLEPCPEFRAETLLAVAAGHASTELELTFRFPPDATLEAFAAEHPDAAGTTAGQIAFGALFATAHFRGDDVEVAFFTTSRALTAILRESAQVRAFFRALGRFSTDGRVLVTDEQNDTSPL